VGPRFVFGGITSTAFPAPWSVAADLVEGFLAADRSGTVVYANPAIEAVVGWRPADLVGQPLSVLMPARLRAAHLEGFASFVAGNPARHPGQPLRVPALRPDGSEVPIELMISWAVAYEAERVVVATIRAGADTVDLERRSQVAEGLLRILVAESERIHARVVEVVATALGWDAATLWVVEADDRLALHQFWGRPGLERFRAACEDVAYRPIAGLPGQVAASAAPRWEADLALDPTLPRASAAAEVGLKAALAFPLFVGARVTGVLELFDTESREPDAGLLASTGEIGRRLGEILARAETQREREALVVELRSAQAAQAALVRTQDYLLRAARALAEASDYADALERLAAIAVPLLGDVCLIDVLADDGRLHRMAARHADPTRQALVERLRREFPPEVSSEHPAALTLRDHRSRWAAELSDEFLRRTTRDEAHYRILKQLGFSSYLTVPILFSRRVLGSLTIVSAGSGRRFGEDDLALVEELAGHAAAVIDRARRLDREQKAAHELQRALLQEALPRVRGLQVAARYLPGAEAAEVGGDWYDVVALPDGHVGFSIGDVAGHDMGAAAAMGQIRHALRAYAIQGLSPSEVVDQLRRFHEQSGIDRMATAVYGRYRPDSGELSFVSAGHLPAMLIRAAGGVERLGADPQPPLGLAGAGPAGERARLQPGDAVVLYTDGLVENRWEDLDISLDRLAAVCRMITSDPEQICDAILAGMGDPRQNDDTALLVMRRT